MNEQERGLIDGLFQRLSEAEAQAGPRDMEAEKLIGERMAKQPNAAYMLAQVVLVQEQGLRVLIVGSSSSKASSLSVLSRAAVS